MKRAFFLFVFLLVFPLPSFSIAQVLKGKAINVADGDTFTLLLRDKTSKKIRLHGIDCPEKSQDFGNVAKQFTTRYLKGKDVVVIPKSKDRYGRIVGLVIMNKDTLNVMLLKAGLAWHFTKYDKNPYWETYEKRARAEKKGLWSLAHPIPPWEWRKGKRTKGINSIRTH